MPTAIYIILGIALPFILLLFLLFSKVRLYISYKNQLVVYAKFWFIKINLSIPDILKKSSFKKLKSREKAISKVKTAQSVSEIKLHPVLTSINEIKALLNALVNRFFKKMHFRYFNVNVDIGCDNAAATALVHAYASQGIAYILDLLRNFSNIDVTESSNITVNSNFISQKSDIEAEIMLDFRLKDYLIFDYFSKYKYDKHPNTED